MRCVHRRCPTPGVRTRWRCRRPATLRRPHGSGLVEQHGSAGPMVDGVDSPHKQPFNAFNNLPSKWSFLSVVHNLSAKRLGHTGSTSPTLHRSFEPFGARSAQCPQDPRRSARRSVTVGGETTEATGCVVTDWNFSCPAVSLGIGFCGFDVRGADQSAGSPRGERRSTILGHSGFSMFFLLVTLVISR